MLSFDELIKKVTLIEKRRQDRYIEGLLGIGLKTLKWEIARANKNKDDLENNRLYEKLVKYCNYRDLDMTSFFNDPIPQEEEETV